MDPARFGRGLRALRRRRGWRQADLAEAAKASRSQVGRIERGQGGPLAIATIDRVAAAAGGSTEVLLRWHGEGLDRLLDEAHAALVEEVVHRLRALGWDVAVEVSFARLGERGSIDVLAFHPRYRALVVVEVKSVTPDMQAMLGGLDRKARLGPAIARERGWEPIVVARLLVVADTRTNRRRLAEHEETVRATLPGDTREVRRWLANPRAPAVSGIWFLANVPGADRIVRQRHRVRRSRDRPGTGRLDDPVGGPPGGRMSKPT